MAGPGGGPSRRSHTKSRKGCKTCKRRHIRCDESYPQCRNCTKHQVRCDYMDNPVFGDDGPRLSGQANLLWTPEIERNVDLWQHTSHFPFPDLQISPQPQWQTFSKIDLRLVYHLASVCWEMQQSRTSKLTIWTQLMPRFLSVAASQPFVMHAILAFSANHIAWIAQSTETRNIAFHHGGVAMKGLHEAIGTFSKANADAVLAASLLLSWQSTDWRGWASLMTGTKTVLSAMQAWGHESVLTELISQQGIPASQTFTNDETNVSAELCQEHLAILQRIQSALQRLQPYLATCEQESRWIDQLSGYIQRLRTSNSPQSSEEQFTQLYALRKWLFWVPVTLLSSRKGDIFTLLVLSHFYSAALALEPLFSHIGTPFLSNIALPPLEELIQIINTVQSSSNFTSMTQAAAAMMEFPRETLTMYRSQRDWHRQQALSVQSVHENTFNNGIEMLNLELGNHIAEYGYNQSLSPAFAPSPLHLSPPMLPCTAPRSPYLEVPRSGAEIFGYSSAGSNFSTPMVSPAMPSPAFKQEEDSSYNFNVPFAYSSGGFVTPTAVPLWT